MGCRAHFQAEATHGEEQDSCCGSGRRTRQGLRVPRPVAAPRGAVPLRRGSEADTYHQADVLDLPNAHIDAFPLVHGQTDVDEVVLVSHAADLHEGEEVAVVVTAFGLQGLAKGHKAARPWSATSCVGGGHTGTNTQLAQGHYWHRETICSPPPSLKAWAESVQVWRLISGLRTFFLKFLIVLGHC